MTPERAHAALRIGGPLAKRCGTCRQPPGADCVLLSGPDGRPVPWPRNRPHAARVKAAPPEAEVRAGDLVILVDRLERLAVIASVSPLLVRAWNPGAGRFSPPYATALLMRLAPEDERTAAARAALAREATP